MPFRNVSWEDPRRTQYKAGYRVFLLLGLFLLGVAVYEYDLWTKFDARVAAMKAGTGPGVVLESSVYAGLYDYGGKWYVVGVNTALAAFFLVVCALLFRQLRRLGGRRETDSSEPPVA